MKNIPNQTFAFHTTHTIVWVRITEKILCVENIFNLSPVACPEIVLNQN